MAETFRQNATKKTIDKRCPFPISHSVPFLLPLLLIFSSIIPTGIFFVTHEREWNNQTSRAWFSSGNVQYETAVTNEGSRCHVRTAQNVQQE
jgi:hypothetical protein